MLKILKQPYPVCNEISCFLKCALVVCPFVYVFLLIFQPFGLNFLEPSLKHPVFLGYAAVCYIMLSLNILILPRLFKKTFDEARWMVLHQMLWEIWTVFTIGAGNYYSKTTFKLLLSAPFIFRANRKGLCSQNGGRNQLF